MSKNTDTFDTLCGDCAGLDLADITIDDVRAQASIYGASEDEIQRAIAGLIEYQALAIVGNKDGGQTAAKKSTEDSAIKLNANCNLTISDYEETEPAEMTSRLLEPHMEGLVEWYGYGSIAGLNARATYYTNTDDDEIAADTGDFGSIGWDTRLSHVDIITDDHVVVVTIHNPDHEV